MDVKKLLRGDIGQIYAGLSGTNAQFDLPVAFGLTPMITQNGVWMEDAFVGGAITLTAKNSPKLDITNIYNLERISRNDTLEGGISLTYGNDFTIFDNKLKGFNIK